MAGKVRLPIASDFIFRSAVQRLCFFSRLARIYAVKRAANILVNFQWEQFKLFSVRQLRVEIMFEEEAFRIAKSLREEKLLSVNAIKTSSWICWAWEMIRMAWHKVKCIVVDVLIDYVNFSWSRFSWMNFNLVTMQYLINLSLNSSWDIFKLHKRLKECQELFSSSHVI